MTLKLSEMEAHCKFLENRRAQSMTVMSELKPFDESVIELVDWARRAREQMLGATEYNREVFHQWQECDPGCECYVCEMEQLLAEVVE